MVTFQMKPGGPAVWGQAFRAAISAHISTGYTKLIGVFHTEYGLLNTGTALDSFQYRHGHREANAFPVFLPNVGCLVGGECGLVCPCRAQSSSYIGLLSAAPHYHPSQKSFSPKVAWLRDPGKQLESVGKII